MKIKEYGWWLLLVIILSFFLSTYGIRWGLPSETLHLQTYHPDEVGVLVSLQRMNPKKFDFNPHFFPWGTFHFYIVGAFLKILSLFHLVILSPYKEFYASHLREMDKLYIYGRMISVFAQTGTVCLLYLLVKRLYSQKAALLSALLVSIMPLSVADAHYLKPNSLSVFFIVWTALISSNLSESKNKKIYILSGFLSGLATATKYNGVWAILFPFLFHFSSFKRKETKRALMDKKLFLIPLFFFIGFFVGCPYSILAFKEFKAGIFHQMNKFILVQHGDIGNPFLYHIFYSLRYGMGTPLFLLTFISVIWIVIKRQKKETSLLIWIISYYLFIASFFKSKFARHMLPILPFISILISRFLFTFISDKKKIFRFTGFLSLVLVFIYTLTYTFAYDNLYISEDSRTKASKWVKKNISPKSEIGVLWQPYFYTPPIIYMEYWVKGKTIYNKDDPKKYNQYKIIVLKGSSAEKVKRDKPDFIVLSEYEYRNALRFPKMFPMEKRLLDFIQNNYIQVKKFENYQQIGKLRFKKGFPPHDLLYPYPTILIYSHKSISSHR